MNKKWTVRYSKLARADLKKFNDSQQEQIAVLINRFSYNPLPKSEGGYGNPLSGELAGYLKIKMLDLGVRILYTLKRRKGRMIVVLIGMRRDDEVYNIALERLRRFVKYRRR